MRAGNTDSRYRLNRFIPVYLLIGLYFGRMSIVFL